MTAFLIVTEASCVRCCFNAVSTDPVFASQLELWLHRLKVDYRDRILSITDEIAGFWGTICPDDPLPEPDDLIAATALHHGMTMVTRNVEHVQRSGVKVLNPWEYK
jgi:toxin FitB